MLRNNGLQVEKQFNLIICLEARQVRLMWRLVNKAWTGDDFSSPKPILIPLCWILSVLHRWLSATKLYRKLPYSKVELKCNYKIYTPFGFCYTFEPVILHLTLIFYISYVLTYSITLRCLYCLYCSHIGKSSPPYSDTTIVEVCDLCIVNITIPNVSRDIMRLWSLNQVFRQ